MYRHTSPEKIDLHKIIRSNFNQVFIDKENHGINLPNHLKREFNKYLSCGLLEEGMARFQCPCCKVDKFVAFSCKGRTICPRCTGRRTADTAKHLLEEVIPEVPVRQWVLSMPYTHRFLLARNPKFLKQTLKLYHREIDKFYKDKAKKLSLNKAKTGAITVIQRFGGALNLNVHFHTMYMDGVFHENYLGEEVFYEITPTHEDIIEITKRLKYKLQRKLLKSETQYEDLERDNSSLLDAQSVQNRDEKMQLPISLGKHCVPPFLEFKGMRCFYLDGFSLHANVKIMAGYRDALERLCRYVLRGPLAKERITLTSNNRVNLKLKTPYNDGTTHLQFTPEQFIKRIISLIPPPRQNLIRYIGVFGARHKKREIITSKISRKPYTQKIKKEKYRTPWSELLKHVYKYEAEFCEKCGVKLLLIASIVSKYECRKILNHLNIPLVKGEEIRARGPPELTESFDPLPKYI